MNQQEFDFNKDVNEPTYNAEENLTINQIVLAYEAKKHNLKDETIIIQLFFEEYCIEISKRLKLLGFFKRVWEFEENSFGSHFLDFLINRTTFNRLLLSEFIILFLAKLDDSFKTSDFQNNSETNFVFDRKITENILNNICNGNTQKAVLLFIVYIKIWNQFKIYIKPFNNNKGLLIHRIFSENVWPKNRIHYEEYSKFEILVQHIINDISNENLYVPFFDNKERGYYSDNYHKERNKLMQSVENLFDYDLTDESEPYHSLIEDILNKPSENAHKKELIRSKVEKLMLPSLIDVKMFIKLYESSTEKEFGKWLLSKFYLFNILNYEN